MFHESGHGGCCGTQVKGVDVLGLGGSGFGVWSRTSNPIPPCRLPASSSSDSTPHPGISAGSWDSVSCAKSMICLECFRQPFLPSLPVRGCPDINVKNTQHTEPGNGSLRSPSPGNMNLIIGYFPSRPHGWDPHLSPSQCKPKRKAALWVQWELLGSAVAVSGGKNSCCHCCFWCVWLSKSAALHCPGGGEHICTKLGHLTPQMVSMSTLLTGSEPEG